MHVTTFQYGDKRIRFEHRDGDYLVHATAMANIFSKRTQHFLDRKQTQRIINAITERVDPEFPIHPEVEQYKKRTSPANNSPKVIVVKANGRDNGTWMHRRLAIEFAAWLDFDFKMWLMDVFDELNVQKQKARS